MDYFIVFVAGMLLAAWVIRWLARQAIDQLLEQFVETQEPENNNHLCVYLEFEQNIYFLYNSDNGSFVAQGNNLAELKTNLTKRFPDRNITIVKGDPEIMKTLTQQLKEANENSTSVGSTS
jgi:ribonuclease HIII